MASRDYRNLIVWKRARALAVHVCSITNGGGFRRDWGFRDQMRRAAISVPSNIAEGNERGSERDGARFFYYARGSLAELSTQADIAKAVGLLEPSIAAGWIAECDELARMLSKLIRFRIESPR
jgi:four helix bundle protein